MGNIPDLIFQSLTGGRFGPAAAWSNATDQLSPAPLGTPDCRSAKPT